MTLSNKGKQMNQNQSTESDVFASCSFSSLGLHPKVCEQLKERLDFGTPTQVQARAIPVILAGQHVLVNATTGSGKTITYLAPIIHHLQEYEPKISRTDGTFALVLVPTRELCMQVYEILQKLLHRFHWIVPGYIMGGENRSKEKARLRKGVSILVATPGRLLDHLKHTASFLHANMRWLIFDEADRILELGFGKEIEEILDLLGSRPDKSVTEGNVKFRNSSFKRQNVLLSATLNEKVNHLAQISLENPVPIGLEDKKIHQRSSLVKLGSAGSDSDDEETNKIPEKVSGNVDEDYRLPPQLIQRYVKVPCGARLAVLLSIVKNLFEREAGQKVVVFFSTCDAVDFHYAIFNDFKWPLNSDTEPGLSQLFLRCKTMRLHGNMEHEERRNTFQAFRTEKSALLLSTDISARGLDFPKVRCIIQYDSPGEATEYVHRVGRTARLGQKGESLLFLQPIEVDYLQDLEKHGVALAEYPLLKVLDSFPSYSLKHQPKRVLSLEMHPWIMALQKALELLISAEPKVQKMAKEAFVSWVRAYTAHRGELKRIFLVKKLHLGHVAKSFALKDQPSLVGKSFHKQQIKKRSRDSKQTKQKQKGKGLSKRRKVSSKG